MDGLKKPLGFPELNLGLNNQKLAILGLFSRALEEKLPVVLPKFSVFVAGADNHPTVPFGQVYSVPHIAKFAAAFGITILDQPPVATNDGWNCFIKGADRLGREAIEGAGMLDEFVAQFFRHLVPVIRGSPMFEKLHAAIYQAQQIRIVSQLRIEKDWAAQSEVIKTRETAVADDYAPTFLEIMEKLRKTISNETVSVYVVCDEANLPVPKEEIRSLVWEHSRISLVWKSDILDAGEQAAFSVLDLSIIDFEMAVRAPVFVGFSRSTFSNLVGYENFVRSGKAPGHQYIYNFPGPALARRHDHGAHVDVRKATDVSHARAPLVPETPEDCYWPAVLTAHIATLGDFSTRNARLPGMRGPALICGSRDQPAKAIEGFSAAFLPTWPHDLEYRAKLQDGSWSPWARNGAYVGSRGMKQVLRGFGARLTGRLGLSHECICAGGFVGNDNVLVARGEEGCFAQDGAALEAMQIIFRPLVI